MIELQCQECRYFFDGRRGTKFCSRECQLAARRKPMLDEAPIHLVIPDTQVKPGVPNDHLRWIGEWAKHRWGGKPLTVIHLGDHWDMPSLSYYDKGTKKMEGRRYSDDLNAGNRGMAILNEAMGDQPQWRKVLLRGNHEDRITRAINHNPQLDGLLSLDLLEAPGWEVHDFLEVVEIDGVMYSHYFYRPNSGKPYGSMPETRLKDVGRSFTMGHQQGIAYAKRAVGSRYHRALIAGSCYQHDEEYRGPQAHNEWRGVAVCNNVEEGDYDLMEVSLDYMCRRFEGHRLRDHAGQEL